jgi:hypothetical protein
LWIVIYNTSTNKATDYPQILTSTNSLWMATRDESLGYSTTNGFTTNATAQAELPFVVKQGSNYFGQPFTIYNASGYTSNQLERGFQFTLDEDAVVSGVTFSNTGSTAFNNFRILADATAPGGTALHSWSLQDDTNETTNDLSSCKRFDSVITLSGGVTYKATVTFTANTGLPPSIQIEDYSSYSSMFDTLRGYDTMTTPWSVIDNGAGGWTIDKSISPFFYLHVQSQPAIASGGMIGGGNLSGGFQ